MAEVKFYINLTEREQTAIETVMYVFNELLVTLDNYKCDSYINLYTGELLEKGKIYEIHDILNLINRDIYALEKTD